MAAHIHESAWETGKELGYAPIHARFMREFQDFTFRIFVTNNNIRDGQYRLIVRVYYKGVCLYDTEEYDWSALVIGSEPGNAAIWNKILSDNLVIESAFSEMIKTLGKLLSSPFEQLGELAFDVMVGNGEYDH